jgi:hypothetical protein
VIHTSWTIDFIFLLMETGDPLATIEARILVADRGNKSLRALVQPLPLTI